MARDIVVDTNVFMHAGNPHVMFFDGARKFVEALEKAAVYLCIDKPRQGAIPSLKDSLIWAEYERKMKATTLGMAVLAKLAASKRVDWISRDVGPTVNKQIRVLIPKNTRDKTFIRVAFGSLEHLFVSNDSSDFGVTVRKRLKRQLGIRVEYSSIDFAKL